MQPYPALKQLQMPKETKPPQGHQDNSIPLFILKSLLQDQTDHVSSLSGHTRALILSDLSQIHGIANPVHGYLLIEKIAVSECQILNKKLVDALELPPWKKSMSGRGIPKLPNHSQRDLVKKIYKGLMERVFKKVKLVAISYQNQRHQIGWSHSKDTGETTFFYTDSFFHLCVHLWYEIHQCCPEVCLHWTKNGNN